MINIRRVEGLLSRFPAGALTLYVAVIAVFMSVTIGNVTDVLERRAAAEANADILDRLGAREPARSPAAASEVTVPAGSPFLEGPTVSVAGATLLQRVAAATVRARGNVLSSQIDLQGPQSKAGFIAVTSSFEIEPESLQALLYDLEAGMPFLFVDQMVAQAPAGAAADGGKLRVLLSVSAQWQGVK